MKGNKSILVIAPRYIPYKYVNGQRMTNISKYLARSGYSVCVLTEKRKNPDKLDLTQGGLIKIIYLKQPMVSKLIEWRPQSIIGKIIKHLSILISEISTKDDYLDTWNRSICNVIRQFAENNPDGVVIATGAPFSIIYHAAKAIEKTSLRYIADFQDPWFEDELANVSKEKTAERIRRYRYVASVAHAKVFVTKGLMHKYNSVLMAGGQGNSTVIENGHSFSILKPQVDRELRQPEHISILHLGTLGNGRDDLLIEWLSKVGIGVRNKKDFKIIHYGHVSTKFERFVRENREIDKLIKLNGYISPEAIPEIAKRADFGLQLNAAAYPYLVSTKIYEYPALALPVISLNYGGEVEDLVEQEKIGKSIDVRLKIDPDDIFKNVDSLKLESYACRSRWKNRAKQFEEIL